MSSPTRPSLCITLPPSPEFHFHDDQQLPRTPNQSQNDNHGDDLNAALYPPPPPRQQFKVKRKRAGRLSDGQHLVLPAGIIPTIEMSEAPLDMSSPTLPSSPSAHLLSPLPLHSPMSRALTPPKTPAPRMNSIYNQAESPAEEWGLINNTTRPFERATSVCSSFSDSSISSCGSSAFSFPNSTYDSPDSETADPFVDDHASKREGKSAVSAEDDRSFFPEAKRARTRREVKWTPQMDEHLMLTFSARLSDPRLTPFKMLPGSHPPMGVCDQVATTAKKTWPQARKTILTVEQDQAISSIEELFDKPRDQRDGSPDTIRPRALSLVQPKWPKVAATRRRLRELCAKRPSISAHYQRMLRTRSPSPFESSSSLNRSSEPPASAFSHDLKVSLATATAPSMQPNAPLARISSDDSTPRARSERPDDWFARIPRWKAHQKSASLQSQLSISTTDFALSTTSQPSTAALDSPFGTQPSSSRAHILRSFGATKSLGRAEFNGRSLDSPVEFKFAGVPTDRRSRKRRFRSDEEKPKRPLLDDLFTDDPPAPTTVRSRGFSLGAARAADSLARVVTPFSTDCEMTEAPSNSFTQHMLSGSRSFPRRLAEPVPRLGSPFVESTDRARQHNTFPRSNLISPAVNTTPFTQRLMALANQQAQQAQQQSCSPHTPEHSQL